MDEVKKPSKKSKGFAVPTVKKESAGDPEEKKCLQKLPTVGGKSRKKKADQENVAPDDENKASKTKAAKKPSAPKERKKATAKKDKPSTDQPEKKPKRERKRPEPKKVRPLTEAEYKEIFDAAINCENQDAIQGQAGEGDGNKPETEKSEEDNHEDEKQDKECENVESTEEAGEKAKVNNMKGGSASGKDETMNEDSKPTKGEAKQDDERDDDENKENQNPPDKNKKNQNLPDENQENLNPSDKNQENQNKPDGKKKKKQKAKENKENQNPPDKNETNPNLPDENPENQNPSDSKKKKRQKKPKPATVNIAENATNDNADKAEKSNENEQERQPEGKKKRKRKPKEGAKNNSSEKSGARNQADQNKTDQEDEKKDEDNENDDAGKAESKKEESKDSEGQKQKPEEKTDKEKTSSEKDDNNQETKTDSDKSGKEKEKDSGEKQTTDDKTENQSEKHDGEKSSHVPDGQEPHDGNLAKRDDNDGGDDDKESVVSARSMDSSLLDMASDVDQWDRPEEIQRRNENTPNHSEAEAAPHTKSHTKSQKPKKVDHKKNLLAPRKLSFDDQEEKTNSCDHSPKTETMKHQKLDAEHTVPVKEGKKKPRSRPPKLREKVKRQESNIEEIPAEMGTWVQCSNAACRKWRYLPDTLDPAEVDDMWTCSLHPDPAFNGCDKAEQDYDESDHILTPYTLGSLVWAKMDGFPWWPAMVDTDPDTEYYCQVPDEDSMVPSEYHVVFLDESVTRSWIRKSRIQPLTFAQLGPGSSFTKGHKFKKEMGVAMRKAENAIGMTLQERLDSFGFEACFRNKHTRWTKAPEKKKKKTKHACMCGSHKEEHKTNNKKTQPSHPPLKKDDNDDDDDDNDDTHSSDGDVSSQSSVESGNLGVKIKKAKKRPSSSSLDADGKKPKLGHAQKSREMKKSETDNVARKKKGKVENGSNDKPSSKDKVKKGDKSESSKVVLKRKRTKDEKVEKKKQKFMAPVFTAKGSEDEFESAEKLKNICQQLKKDEVEVDTNHAPKDWKTKNEHDSDKENVPEEKADGKTKKKKKALKSEFTKKRDRDAKDSEESKAECDVSPNVDERNENKTNKKDASKTKKEEDKPSKSAKKKLKFDTPDQDAKEISNDKERKEKKSKAKQKFVAPAKSATQEPPPASNDSKKQKASDSKKETENISTEEDALKKEKPDTLCESSLADLPAISEQLFQADLEDTKSPLRSPQKDQFVPSMDVDDRQSDEDEMLLDDIPDGKDKAAKDCDVTKKNYHDDSDSDCLDIELGEDLPIPSLEQVMEVKGKGCSDLESLSSDPLELAED